MSVYLKAPKEVSESRAWLETLLVTAIAFIVPVFFSHDDPFFYQSEFCWPLIGPMLIALRYGFSNGLVSVLTLFAIQIVSVRLGLVTEVVSFPLEPMVGYLLLILCAGEFRDWWGRTNEQQRYQLEYVEDRLETFTRHYHLLKTSHDRLEQLLAGHSLSLRESLQAVRSAIGQLEDRRIDLAAKPILTLFIEYGAIQTGSLYKVDDDGNIEDQPLASVGPVTELKKNDPLLKAMFEDGQLVSFKQLDNELAEISPYQVAIPLTDVSEKIYAVLLVEQIQFFSLTKETLTLLAVIAGHVGDLLRHAISNPIMEVDELSKFKAQIKRAEKEAKRYRIPAQVLKLRADKETEETRQVLEYLNATRRGLDVYLFDQANFTLTLLMPLADELDHTGFINRIDVWAKERYGKNLEEIGIHVEQQISLPSKSGELNKLFGM